MGSRRAGRSSGGQGRRPQCGRTWYPPVALGREGEGAMALTDWALTVIGPPGSGASIAIQPPNIRHFSQLPKQFSKFTKFAHILVHIAIFLALRTYRTKGPAATRPCHPAMSLQGCPSGRNIFKIIFKIFSSHFSRAARPLKRRCRPTMSHK